MATAALKENKTRRDKGDGSVTFIKARNIWCAQIDIGVAEDGKRIRKSFSGKSKQEALAKRNEFLRLGDKEKALEKALEKWKLEHRLDQYIIDYLVNFKKTTVTPRTFAWYRDLSNHIIDGLGNKNIENLTALDIQKFLNVLSVNKSDKTIKEIKGLLNQVLRHAVIQDIIPYNPFDKGVKIPKAKRMPRKGKALPENICQNVMAAIEKSPTYRPMITALLHTGIRVGELLAIRWDNIDRDNIEIGLIGCFSIVYYHCFLYNGVINALHLIIPLFMELVKNATFKPTK